MVKVNTENTKLGGGGFLNEGEHHTICDDVKVEQGQYGLQVHAHVKSLAGKPISSIGLDRTEFLDVEGEHAGRFVEFSIAHGIITREEYEAAKSKGLNLEIDENLLIGRQAIVKFRKGKGDKVYANWFHLDHPDGKDVPRDVKSLPPSSRGNGNGNAGGNGAGAQGNAGNGNQSAPPSQQGNASQSQPAGAGAGGGQWGGNW